MKGVWSLLSLLVVAVAAQEHFIDVRELVQDTLDAIKEAPSLIDSNSTAPTAAGSPAAATSSLPSADVPAVPAMPARPSESTNSVYKSLLKLPADIMSRLALDAGFGPQVKKTSPTIEEKRMPLVDDVKQKSYDEKVEASSEGESSFKTLEDIQMEDKRRQNERPTLAKAEENKDLFSIKELIAAAGNAIREAQKQESGQVQPQIVVPTIPPLAPLPTPLEIPAIPAIPMPKNEIMYRQVVRDGKIVYEQVVLQTMPDGSTKVVSQNLFQQLPQVEPKPKAMEIKNVDKSAAEFLAPTFPPMVNVFDQFTSTTPSAPESTPESTTTTTTEEPPVVVKKPTKKLLRRKIEKVHLEKKIPDMHSRQFGAKTIQMSDPIKIEVEENKDEVATTTQSTDLSTEATLRVRTVNRKRKSSKVSKGLVKEYETKVVEKEEKEEAGTETEKGEEEENEEEPVVTQPPVKKRKTLRSSKKTTKEIRKFPELYDEQWKTQVAPSVAPPSEDFVEQFENVDVAQEKPKTGKTTKSMKKVVEAQNDAPITDAMEMRNSKVDIQQLTPQQEEAMLDKEIHKRVIQRIRSAKTESNEDEKPSADAEEDSEDANDEECEEEEESSTTKTTTTTTTTTNAPVTRAERVRKTKKTKKTLVTHNQCLNLRSFSHQFLFDNIADFAKEYCFFIEHYYPTLTCAKREKYVEKCEKVLAKESN